MLTKISLLCLEFLWNHGNLEPLYLKLHSVQGSGNTVWSLRNVGSLLGNPPIRLDLQRATKCKVGKISAIRQRKNFKMAKNL